MIGPRLRAIAVKEIWATLRDPRARMILILPPILQLLIFGFASTMEVKNFRVGVLDLDGGRWSREIIERLVGSPSIREVVRLRSQEDLRRAIDRQKVIVTLQFGPGFSADVAAGRGASIGAVYDGRRSNASQIVSGYIERIARDANAQVASRPALSLGAVDKVNWFNPALESLWFVMPALIAIIAAVSSQAVVGQSVARERELGTFDQLMVSPLRVHEILIGKMLPPMLVGMFNITLFVILVPTVFGVPLTGSLAMFYVAAFFYLLALSGIGMLVSTLSATQQQAFMSNFATAVPMIVLSGYISPVENMPGWLQAVTLINPPAWFIPVCEGTFLKAMPASAVLANTWPIALIAAVAIAAASLLFRHRME